MEDKKNPFRWVIASLWFLIIFFSAMALFCVPPLFTEITREIPLTKAQMGTIFGMAPLASLFLAFMAGSISDRFGSRWVVGGSLFIVALSGGLRGISGSALELIVYSFLMGAGSAIFMPNIPKVLGNWFPREELGKANGLVISAIPIGGALSIATAADFMSPAFGGWRGVMVALGCVYLVITILWFVIYKENDSKDAAERGKQGIFQNFSKVLKVRDVWLVAVFFGLYYAACGTVSGLLPVLLSERGIARPGGIVSLFMFVGIVATPLGGIAIDKFGRRKPFLIICPIVMALGFPLLAKLEGAALIITLIVVGSAAGVVVPLKTALPFEIDRIGAALAATSMGFMMMVGYSMGFLGPAVTGKIIDVTGSPLSAFVLMALCLLMAAGIAVSIKETGRKKNTGV